MPPEQQARRQVELLLRSGTPLWSVAVAFPETGSWCQSRPWAGRAGGRQAGASAMALRKELLKSIWYAFTALDVEKSGKVSKSQLKVRTPGAQGGWQSTIPAPVTKEPGMKPVLPWAPSHPAAPAAGVGWGEAQCWATGPTRLGDAAARGPGAPGNSSRTIVQNPGPNWWQEGASQGSEEPGHFPGSMW